MNKKTRYRWGFWFGKNEHKFRHYTTLSILASLGLATAWFYFPFYWLPYLTIGTLILTVILNFTADMAHRLEKKFMDELRFRRK